MKLDFKDLKNRKTILICEAWHIFYVVRKVINQFWNRYSNYVLLVSGAVFCFMSLFFAADIQELLLDCLKTENLKDTDISLIKTTLSSIGVCLIGVSGITFTLGMFSIQQSSEKLPYTFFQQIQRDRGVIVRFALLFIIALFISILPIGIQLSNIAFLLLSCSWLIVIYITLIVYTYKGAIELISPISNLDALANSLEKKFKFWRTYFNRIVPKEAYPLFDIQQNNQLKRPQVYLQQMPEIQESLKHLFYIVQRYARDRDFEITNHALNNTLIKLNELYIKEKAGAFYANTIFAKNPLSTDEYLNETLEKLKQTFDDAIARNEDAFAIQVLQAFYQLIGRYADIEYKDDLLNSKPYAVIAFDILCQCVSLANAQKRVEVVLNGVRILGVATQTLLSKTNLSNIEKGVETIVELSIKAVTAKEGLPVLFEGVKQLSELSKVLIDSQYFNIKDSANIIKKAFREMAIATMSHPEKNISQVLLAPVFSVTEQNSLINYFSKGGNSSFSCEGEHATIEKYIKNFYFFLSSDNWELENTLLRAALKLRSPLTSDLINWIVAIYKASIQLSELKIKKPDNAQNNIENIQQQLYQKARGVFFIFIGVSSNEETASLLETYNLTIRLVEMILFAFKQGASVMFDAVDVLVRWGVSSLSSRTLTTTLCTLVALNIKYGNAETTEQIKNKFNEFLRKNTKSWQVVELQKAKETLESKAFEVVDDLFNPNIRIDIERIIKNNAARAELVAKELALVLDNVLAVR